MLLLLICVNVVMVICTILVRDLALIWVSCLVAPFGTCDGDWCWVMITMRGDGDTGDGYDHGNHV